MGVYVASSICFFICESTLKKAQTRRWGITNNTVFAHKARTGNDQSLSRSRLDVFQSPYFKGRWPIAQRQPATTHSHLQLEIRKAQRVRQFHSGTLRCKMKLFFYPPLPPRTHPLLFSCFCPQHMMDHFLIEEDTFSLLVDNRGQSTLCCVIIVPFDRSWTIALIALPATISSI